jgi:ABC-2 type transport system ATP-binding protein
MVPFLDIVGLRHQYGPQVALHDVTINLAHGAVGLLGPNGAGKSTFLKILLGLLAPSAGTGHVLGQPLGAGISLRRVLGYMPEADSLVPGLRGVDYVALAGELCGMPRKQAQRRGHELLSALGLDEARYRKLEEYSTGMRQRLKLAQALVHDPPALLLDEPTSGLDPAGRDAMLDLLGRLARDHGKALLLSTHLLGDVERVCGAVVILHKGRVLCQGRVEDLCLQRHDRYRLSLDGPCGPYLDDLRLEGATVVEDNGKGDVRIVVPAGWATRGFFLLAEHNNVIVRGLEPDHEDLEELFHRLIDVEMTSSGKEPGATGA